MKVGSANRQNMWIFLAEIDHCDSDLESHRMRMIKKNCIFVHFSKNETFCEREEERSS